GIWRRACLMQGYHAATGRPVGPVKEPCSAWWHSIPAARPEPLAFIISCIGLARTACQASERCSATSLQACGRHTSSHAGLFGYPVRVVGDPGVDAVGIGMAAGGVGIHRALAPADDADLYGAVRLLDEERPAAVAIAGVARAGRGSRADHVVGQPVAHR